MLEKVNVLSLSVLKNITCAFARKVSSTKIFQTSGGKVLKINIVGLSYFELYNFTAEAVEGSRE